MKNTLGFRFYQFGGPEVLKWESHNLPHMGVNDVLVRHTAVGVNFVDTYYRTGLYPVGLPSGIGTEAAGYVEAMGSDVKNLAVGDRVAYCMGHMSAYARANVVSEDALVKIPESIHDHVAAAVLLKGLTAGFFLTQTYPVKKGETILLHAAAGGVGQILTQWAKHIGATVIGTVGSEKKAKLARSLGCDHTILYREEHVSERVRELTNGKGVPVVYDSVGRDTFKMSLNSLARFGMFISYGNASGPVEPFSPGILASKGSLYFTRPTVRNNLVDTRAFREMAGKLFKLVETGVIKVQVQHRYPLEEAPQAHRDLEARKTTGSIVLEP